MEQLKGSAMSCALYKSAQLVLPVGIWTLQFAIGYRLHLARSKDQGQHHCTYKDLPVMHAPAQCSPLGQCPRELTLEVWQKCPHHLQGCQYCQATDCEACPSSQQEGTESQGVAPGPQQGLQG